MHAFAYLQCSRTLSNDFGGVSQCPRRLVLTFGGNHLGTGLSGSLGLGGHGPLKLLRKPYVFSVISRISTFMISLAAFVLIRTLQLAPLSRPRGRWLHPGWTASYSRCTLSQRECHPSFWFRGRFCKKQMRYCFPTAATHTPQSD